MLGLCNFNFPGKRPYSHTGDLMLRPLLLASALTLVLAGGAFAAPNCMAPQHGGLRLDLSIDFGKYSETERAELYERRLQQRGINASNTRFWGECVQTFVRENGRTTMRLYDPFTLEELH